MQWVLVLWEKEDAVSLVKESSIVSPKSDFCKGTICKVKYGSAVLEAKVLDVGELQCMCIGDLLLKVLRVNPCKV